MKTASGDAGVFSDLSGRRGVYSALVLISLVGLATRLPFLSTPAVWIDESFSIYYAAKGLQAFWGRDWLVDPTPPAYYSLLAVWQFFFGLAEPALRALSLVLTCLAAMNLFWIGRLLRSAPAGLVSALLWLLMPLSMEYSLEIRAYALQQFFLTGMMLALALFIRRRQIDPSARSAFMVEGWLATALALLAFYTHVTSVFAILGFALATLFHFAAKQDARAIRSWLLFGGVFALGAAPQVWASYHVVMGNGETLAWLPAGTLSWILWTLRSLFIGETSVGALTKILILAVWFLALLKGFFAVRRDMAARALLVLGPCLGFSLLLLFSLFIPILLPRTAMWATAPLALLAGIGMAPLSARVSAPLMVLAAIGLLFLAQAKMEQRASWRSDERGLNQIAARDAEPLVVTVDGERACIMAYYGKFSGRVRLLDLEGAQVFKRTQNVDLGCNDPPPIRIDELRRRLLAGEAIWVVGSTDPSDERTIEIVRLSKTFSDSARITEKIDETGFFAARFEATHR